MHLEFVVLGPPVSNQASGPKGTANLNTWKAKVKGEVQKIWKSPPLKDRLKAILINFHIGDMAPVDVDNLSKPILDVMNGIVYKDDRQIRQAEITHLRIDTPVSVVGVSRILLAALQVGSQFVYVRIEDPVEPYPLPKERHGI